MPLKNAGVMKSIISILAALSIWFILTMYPVAALAGPPFLTDDPEPVEYRHWEVYLASQYMHDRDATSATAPHVEINYGLVPNVQIHLIAPMMSVRPKGDASHYGYGDTEIGIKYRFIQETDTQPMAGVFPLIEVPTGDKSRGLGNGTAQLFLPLWLQKSLGPWTTYGGGGYWINPGQGNRDYWSFGWEAQRDISEQLTIGVEIFHKTPAEEGGDSETGFNVGAIINFNQMHHLLLSTGRDLSGPNLASFYISYQLTFGP